MTTQRLDRGFRLNMFAIMQYNLRRCRHATPPWLRSSYTISLSCVFLVSTYLILAFFLGPPPSLPPRLDGHLGAAATATQQETLLRSTLHSCTQYVNRILTQIRVAFYSVWLNNFATYWSLNVDVYVVNEQRQPHWISVQTLQGESWKRRLQRIIKHQLTTTPKSASVPLPAGMSKNVSQYWFMTNGTVFPEAGFEPEIWPKIDGERDDRIINQLMYVPKGYSQQASELKRIWIVGAWYDLLPERELFIRDRCPVNTCTVQKYTPDNPGWWNDTDAAVFRDKEVYQKLPDAENKVRIFFTLENSFNTGPSGVLPYEDLANWAATFRTDSHLVAPYFKYVPYHTDVIVLPQTENIAANKKYQVAWMVSNCYAMNDRMSFALKLKLSGVQVHLYGSCHKRHCHGDCWKKLGQKYKFYLAFENGNCNDYITEKFQSALLNNMVPIVMGPSPAFYRKVAPYGSFIHVDDFPSIQHLADYIHKVDNDDQLYNSYFRWHGTGEFINTFFLCRICALLHAPKPPQSPPYHRTDLHHINSWWSDRVCIRGSTDPEDSIADLRKNITKLRHEARARNSKKDANNEEYIA